MKKKVIIALLCLHLLVILLGTSLMDFSKVPLYLQGPVIYYLSLVGGHSYNFFSPDIPTQVIVECHITDYNNKLITETFAKTNNTFQFRSTYLFQMLDHEDQPEVAAQIASDFCFHEYANARSIRVVISRYMVPSIEDFKKGQKCGLMELYTHTYDHD